jgi:hypothetical protein
MKKVMLIIVFITSYYICKSQVVKMEYLKSYSKVENNQEISFLRLINTKGKLMTVQEALEYVYHGDSSKLYCYEIVFDMEKEKVISKTRKLFLPEKYFLIEFSNFYLIANCAYSCPEDDIFQVYLILHIINKKDLKIMDSLKVYEGNEYNDELAGMINPANGKIFINGYNNHVRYAKLIGINRESLRFEVIKEKNNVQFSSENWVQEVKNIGWYDDFYGN